MSSIEKCCHGMETMINDGTIKPFTAFGHKTGEINAIGNGGIQRNYNKIKYCPFCAKELRLK